MAGSAADRRTRLTVLVALAASRVIAAATTSGGLVSGSPALLSEAAHSGGLAGDRAAARLRGLPARTGRP